MDVRENCSQGMWLSYEALKLGILEVREFLYGRLRKIREGYRHLPSDWPLSLPSTNECLSFQPIGLLRIGKYYSVIISSV